MELQNIRVDICQDALEFWLISEGPAQSVKPRQVLRHLGVRLDNFFISCQVAVKNLSQRLLSQGSTLKDAASAN